MPKDTVCKIIRQYNQEPIPAETMQKLQEIAADYTKVKNQVYQRYGGIRSLSKLYPGYTVQNEMTKSGLREALGLPSVYFYLAVFDALRDIKSQWSRTKQAVLGRVNANEQLDGDEKHFIRYVLKVGGAFEAVLNETQMKLPKDLQKQYDQLASRVDEKKLCHYLCRQVRNDHKKLHTESADGFAIAERAYRYADHGIYISVKEKRKRVFLLLTDRNVYDRQLYIRLYPDQKAVEIQVPVDISVRKHKDYTARVGVSMGMRTMLVTDAGRIYGADYGRYQEQLSDWIREQGRVYSQNREANPGRKKYQAKKHRLEEQLHSYINQELNRFLETEKPGVVYVPRFPRSGTSGPVKRINHLAGTWQRGYMKNRLALKCQEHSIKFQEVFAGGIGRECSQCGAGGKEREGTFVCPSCGYVADRKVNAARNVLRRGEGQRSRS